MFRGELCKTTIAIALGCALSSLFGGSATRADDKIRGATLEAFVFQTWHQRHKTWCYGPCSLSESGLGPEAPPAAGVLAGYYDTKDAGLFSGEQVNTVYRGGVRFDLDQKGPDGKGFDGVPEGFAKAAEGGAVFLLQAALIFNHERPSGEGCETTIYLANADWPSVLDNGLIPTTRTDGDYVDTIPPWEVPPPGSLATFVNINVFDRVTSWLAFGTASNHGFAFVGPEENLDAEGNWRCMNAFSHFKLELKYLVREKLPPAAIIPLRPRIPPPSQRVVHTMDAGTMSPAFAQRLRQPRAAQPNLPRPRQ